MKRYLAMIAFLFVSTVPSSSFGFDATLTINVTKLPDNRICIIGKTNLPLGTELMLSVEEKMNNGFFGQSSCVVSDKGTFNSEAFGPKGGLKNGRYVAEVLMPIPAVQPVAVKEIIGRNGENLTGKLINKDEFGITVSQQTEFTIGTAPDKAQADRKKQTEKSTSILKRQLCIYLDELLSFKDDPEFKQWGFSNHGPYGEWLKSVEVLQQAQPIGNHPIPLVLRAAPGDLLMLGMSFMHIAAPTHTGMRESNTRYIRQMLPEIKDTIDFNSYLQNIKR